MVSLLLQALRCIGDLVVAHPKNRELLGSKIVGEEPDSEPALHCILRVLLRTSNLNECIAADYVFKCFCEVPWSYNFQALAQFFDFMIDI